MIDHTDHAVQIIRSETSSHELRVCVIRVGLVIPTTQGLQPNKKAINAHVRLGATSKHHMAPSAGEAVQRCDDRILSVRIVNIISYIVHLSTILRDGAMRHRLHRLSVLTIWTPHAHGFFSES